MATPGGGTIQQITVTFMLEEDLEKMELNETGWQKLEYLVVGGVLEG